MSEVSSKELYEFKKTLKELSQKRGRGTELVSVYIPPDKQLSDVGKHMRDELGLNKPRKMFSQLLKLFCKVYVYINNLQKMVWFYLSV